MTSSFTVKEVQMTTIFNYVEISRKITKKVSKCEKHDNLNNRCCDIEYQNVIIREKKTWIC